MKRTLCIILALLILAAFVTYYLLNYRATVESSKYDCSVEIWYVDDGSVLWENFGNLVNKYQRGPGDDASIYVNTRSFASEDEMTAALVEGSSMPQIIFCDSEASVLYCTNGIDSVTDQSITEEQIDLIDNLYLSACFVNHRLVSLPVAALPDVLIVNNELLAQYENYNPSVMNTMEGLCANASGYAEALSKPFFTTNSFAKIMKTGMADLGDVFHATHDADIQSENYIYMYNLLAECAFDGGMYSSENDAAEEFFSGNCACALLSAEDLVEHSHHFDSDKYTVAAYPYTESGEALYCPDVLSAIIVSSDQTRQKACGEFVFWLAEQSSFVQNSGYFSVLDPATTVHVPGNTKAVKAVAAAYELQMTSGSMHFVENPGEYYYYKNDFEEDFRNIISGLTPQMAEAG